MKQDDKRGMQGIGNPRFSGSFTALRRSGEEQKVFLKHVSTHLAFGEENLITMTVSLSSQDRDGNMNTFLTCTIQFSYPSLVAKIKNEYLTWRASDYHLNHLRDHMKFCVYNRLYKAINGSGTARFGVNHVTLPTITKKEEI